MVCFFVKPNLPEKNQNIWISCSPPIKNSWLFPHIILPVLWNKTKSNGEKKETDQLIQLWWIWRWYHSQTNGLDIMLGEDLKEIGIRKVPVDFLRKCSSQILPEMMRGIYETRLVTVAECFRNLAITTNCGKNNSLKIRGILLPTSTGVWFKSYLFHQ